MTQQGDLESPALFWDSIQDPFDSLESNINLRCLDDGNLTDEHRIVLEDLKKLLNRKKPLGLKIKHTNCESVFLVPSLKNEYRHIASFQKLCLGIKTLKKDELIFLGSSLGPKLQAELLEKKLNELEQGGVIVEKLDAQFVFFYVERSSSH